MTRVDRETLFKSALQDRPALLVDPGDSPYGAILKELGVGVRAAPGVPEAARWAGEEAFCVAMIVLRPPDTAGFEVARALRERCKLTQLVFISPSWNAELLRTATAFGRARTIETPRDFKAFRELLRRQITTWTTTATVGTRKSDGAQQLPLR